MKYCITNYVSWLEWEYFMGYTVGYMGKQFQLGFSMYQQQYIMGFDWGYNGNIMWMHGI